ncbi:MAG: insulinase family protein [Gemmatimonadetes bacterium]|nr:insulinase family protein [Gemmatimonadota bacterium]MBI3504593.1 insulinase family protein [Pseudomonadota bacterium]
MKRWYLLVTFAVSTAGAQVDTATVSYTVGGVHVIQRRTPASIVVANLYLLGGLRQVAADRAGLESFLLAVSERGSQKYPRDAMRRALARTGSEIGVGPREDWTVVGVHTTPSELDSTWAVFADRLMHPTIDSADVEFVREQLISGVRQRADSPDALLDYLSDSIAYAGQPYALSAVGTEATLARITRADLRAYHREQFVTSRMLLVVVGNVSRSKVESLVRNTLGHLPAGTYHWTAPVVPTRLGADAVIVARSLPTNYVQGVIAGPAANDPDAPAVRVAAAVLSGRLFAEIRSKRNLTYAVSANYRDRGLTSIALYVTTTAPDTTVALMKHEVRFLEEANIPTENLGPLVAQFITEYFLDNETTTAQADFLARAELYRGDFHAGAQFVSELRNVTGDDIKRVVTKYFHDVRWAYVGDPARVQRDRLLTFP